MTTPIPAVTSLECSPDAMPIWTSAVGVDTDVTNHFGGQCPRGFHVASGGTLVVTCENGNPRTFAVATGGFYAIRVSNVWASGSTAFGLIFVG